MLCDVWTEKGMLLSLKIKAMTSQEMNAEQQHQPLALQNTSS
jgi:hypothetical protein